MPTHAEAAYCIASGQHVLLRNPPRPRNAVVSNGTYVAVNLWESFQGTNLSAGAASGRLGRGWHNKGARDRLVASANENSARPVGGVLGMGSLVGESLDLKTVGFRSGKKRVGLTGRRAGSVALTTLLSPTGSEGNLSAKGDGSKSRELHSEGGYWFRLVQRGRRGDNGWSWIWWMLKGRW